MIYCNQEIGSFTDSNIVYLAEAYSQDVTYGIGDLVRVGKYQYKSTLDGNLGNNPLSKLGIYWIKWQSANDFAALDLFSESKTEWTGDGWVEFDRLSKDVIGIGNFKATQVLIKYYDDSHILLDTEEYNFSNNGNVYDEWSYGYSEFTDSTSRVIFKYLERIGTTMRIEFIDSNDTNTYCGFLVSGRAVDMGDTLDNVSFPDKRIGSRTVNVANFSTTMDKSLILRRTSSAKSLVDEPMLFIIDPLESSSFDNLVILGKINKVDAVFENMNKNNISWEIEQQIIS